MMNEWLEFNFHDYATMRVARQAPTAALLADIFAPFLTSRVPEHHDLTVTGEIVPIRVCHSAKRNTSTPTNRSS